MATTKSEASLLEIKTEFNNDIDVGRGNHRIYCPKCIHSTKKGRGFICNMVGWPVSIWFGNTCFDDYKERA